MDVPDVPNDVLVRNTTYSTADGYSRCYLSCPFNTPDINNTESYYFVETQPCFYTVTILEVIMPGNALNNEALKCKTLGAVASTASQATAPL